MPARRQSRLSLTQRLTLYFSVVVALAVLVMGTLFLAVTEYHFVGLDQATLEDKRRLIEKVLRDANSIDDARWRLGEVLNYHQGLMALVQDGQGSAVFESKGFDAGLQDQTAAHRGGHGAIGTAMHGQAASQTLEFDAPVAYSPAPLRVWIALDAQAHAPFLAALRRSVVIYAIAALLLCGVLSWLAARQGLAPLREMKSRAARVTGQDLGQRMPVQAVPVEMADLAEELNRMLDRLQGDFQRLTDFSTDLAHELRTPINNLLTQTQVALATQRDAATYREILASNAEEFERLARMVADMLFLAKTERGVDLPRKEVFPAHPDIVALLEFYEAMAEERRVRLRLEGDGQLEGDRLMFRRAVSNLLSNALQHTPEGGEVTIRIAAIGGSTTVAVENTGIDIDAKKLSRLFDRFYRADPARAHPGSEGAGLGLAITRAIVKAHGGSVTATSSGGRTRFVLTFPHGTGESTPAGITYRPGLAERRGASPG